MKIGIIILFFGIAVAHAQEEQGRPPDGQLDVTGRASEIQKATSRFVDKTNEGIKTCSNGVVKNESNFLELYKVLSAWAKQCGKSGVDSANCAVDTPEKKSGIKGILQAWSKKNESLDIAMISKNPLFNCLLTKEFSNYTTKLIEDKNFVNYTAVKSKVSKKEAREIRAFYRELLGAAKKE